MSLKSDRLLIYPSRSSQLQLKMRLNGAQKGHSMLKKKSDALQMKYRKICSDLSNAKLTIRDAVREANYSLARAKYYGIDFKTIILQQIGLNDDDGNRNTAQITLNPIRENIAGVNVLAFECVQNDNEFMQLYCGGLSNGGQQLNEVKKKFQFLTRLLIDMASLELSHDKLKLNLINLNRRINSIQHVLIPKILNTLSYIDSELDEIEREEFYRLKKIQKNKKKKCWIYQLCPSDGLPKKTSCCSIIPTFHADGIDKDVLF